MSPLSSAIDGTRWRRMLVVAALLLLVLAGVTIHSLLADRTHSDGPPVPGAGRPVRADRDHAATGGPPIPDITAVSDPELFARAVAGDLFGWDTATAMAPSDITDRLVRVADPTGESSAGLVADIANYLPTTGAWHQLREYSTRQWIEVTATHIPNLWATAVHQAGPDGLLPGTTAYTVHGVRHRAGVWEGEQVSTAHDVAFTAFVVCGPSYPQCHLLRLSQLDDPLD